MSSALAFDTYAYVKKLRDAGMPEAQAGIQVEAIAALIEQRMATKQDLELQGARIEVRFKEAEARIGELDVKLETRIKELDVKLETRIKELEREIRELGMTLTLRLGGLLLIGIGALATLIKVL